MNNLFAQSRSHWVRYDRYELKTAADGKRYITPGKNAKPDIYNPLKEAPGIVLDALNVSDKASGTALLDQLEQVTGVKAPQPLATLKDKKVRFDGWTEKEQMKAVVTDFLK